MSYQTILRTLIASGIVVGAVAALSPAAFAATDNATQSGSITAIETVDYVAGPSLTIVPNTLQADQNFGSVQVQSNSNNGWTLAVASTNGSVLKNGAIAAIAYTLKVDGAAVDVSTAATPVNTSLDPASLTAAAGTGNNYLVKGSIAAIDSNGKPAGTYSDTLTFTLTNK
jgi:hypothetical protein